LSKGSKGGKEMDQLLVMEKRRKEGGNSQRNFDLRGDESKFLLIPIGE